MDERSLIASCQRGETEAFAELYSEYAKKIYSFVYYRVQHVQTAQDATSTVFMKALERIGSYDAEKGKFSSWLYQIARNTVIDLFRAQMPMENIDNVWDITDGTDIAHDAEIHEQLRQVREKLGDLSEEQRNLIVMRVWDGLSYREIAEILGKTETNCRVSFSRAIRSLRKKVLIALLCVSLSLM